MVNCARYNTPTYDFLNNESPVKYLPIGGYKANTRYHMNNGYFESSNINYPSYSTYFNEYNMKFVSTNGMYEVVVTPDTDISQMSDDEIQNYLKDASHWQILTADYNKAQNNPNFKYDPVNVGTYNYCSYETSIPGHDKPEDKRLHSILDVLPYRDDGGNWGNVSGLIYGNSTSARKYNGDYHDTHSLIDINKEYENEQDEVFIYWEKIYK